MFCTPVDGDDWTVVVRLKKLHILYARSKHRDKAKSQMFCTPVDDDDWTLVARLKNPHYVWSWHGCKGKKKNESELSQKMCL